MTTNHFLKTLGATLVVACLYLFALTFVGAAALIGIMAGASITAVDKNDRPFTATAPLSQHESPNGPAVVVSLGIHPAPDQTEPRASGVDEESDSPERAGRWQPPASRTALRPRIDAPEPR